MKVVRAGICLIFALVLSAQAQQNLDPVFRIASVNGDCHIRLPDQADFVPAEESKAYPYGSQIRTGSRSSLVMVMSEGNVVRVLANADVVFNEDASNTKIKNVRLNDGEVEVDLKKNFYEGGNALNVETATAICGAIGSQFRVASRLEQDLRIVIVRVIRGLIRVYGEHFDVTELKADEWLSLLSPADRSFIRLKNMKGAFNILIKDENLNDKVIPTKEGTVLKIWRRDVPETGQVVITAQLTNPQGELIETVTVILGDGQEAPEGGVDVPVPGWDEEERTDGRDKRPGRDADNPLPPEDFMDDLIKGVLDDVNVEYRRGPTPTPVGRR